MQISPTIGDIIRPQIVAGNVPDFISMNDNDTSGLISSLIRENALMDITDVFEGPGLEDTSPLKDQVLDGVLDTAKCSPYSDGKIYLAPFNASPLGLVYNKTLFKENNWELPETWDEFFELGDKAKEKGIALLTYAGQYPGYMESLLWPAIASRRGPGNSHRYQQLCPWLLLLPRGDGCAGEHSEDFHWRLSDGRLCGAQPHAEPDRDDDEQGGLYPQRQLDWREK